MSRGAAKARAKPPKTAKAKDLAPSELMPQDLAEKGWELLEHQGENEDEYQCVNRARNLDTRLSHKPQQVIEAARKMQAKIEQFNVDEQPAGEAEGDTAPSPRASFPRMLQRRLTAEEIDGLIDELTAHDERIATLTHDRDEIVKRYKEDIAAVEGDRAGVLRTLKARSEETEVLCREVFDYDAGQAVCYRNDTNEEVERRPLTPREMHRPLPFA